MGDTVKLLKENGLATISFSRVEKYNAFNDELSADLAAAVADVKRDKNMRAVLLQGEGPAFMVGGDIHFFHQHLDDFSSASQGIFDNLHSSVVTLKELPIPVLCKVHGSVAGVGMSLMLACDFVIAEENTKFTTAYMKLGLSPDGGFSYFLPRIVGKRKAMELFALSEIFDASKALDLGLINWKAAADSLEEETQKQLKGFLRLPAYAFAKVKGLLNESEENTLAEHLEAEAKSFVSCTSREEFKRGLEAFINKSAIKAS